MNSGLHPIPMPKPIKAPKPPGAPKIDSIHVRPMQGGFSVQHNMTHGPQPVPFVFQDPRKMASHLSRLENSAWREPERNEGPAITKDLNLGKAV